MRAKSIMVLGTASGVGKSFVTAGLCRLFSDWGYRVAPFKAQNMSNNSFVTDGGGEIGRAQAVQAECARLRPHTDMNPILLKPAADNCSQVVIQGKPSGHFSARDYYAQKSKLKGAIWESFERLAQVYDVVVIEGAGSPAEINLKQNDLVNMAMAEMADAQCLLVGDIDRGGVFASFVGTLELLEAAERERIAGFVINKFRGDPTLVASGVEMLEKKTGKPVLGVLPYARNFSIDEEDALSLESVGVRAGKESETLDIAVIHLPHLSNFTDFEILKQEPNVCLRYIRTLREFGRPDLLILPGTKSTMGDLAHLAEHGLHEKILEYVNGGGRMLGICGGYQMMGKWIQDLKNIESDSSQMEGLGIFNMTTEFVPEKILRQVSDSVKASIFGRPVQGQVTGYEIHMGQTVHQEIYPELGHQGVIHPAGRLMGTYYHGFFDNAELRISFLKALAHDCNKLPESFSAQSAPEIKEKHYKALAEFLQKNLNAEMIHSWLR